MRGTAEPQTGFYRTFRIEPPFLGYRHPQKHDIVIHNNIFSELFVSPGYNNNYIENTCEKQFLHVPLFPMKKNCINYNYIHNCLENYFCCQVTITITWMFRLQIIYVNNFVDHGTLLKFYRYCVREVLVVSLGLTASETKKRYPSSQAVPVSLVKSSLLRGQHPVAAPEVLLSVLGASSLQIDPQMQHHSSLQSSPSRDASQSRASKTNRKRLEVLENRQGKQTF